ncbi:MAG: TRAP transporter large permease [Actinobacteria bacterium]|nr:TRAP transporter large permease [Actinomycetota bacterium]
MSDVTVALLGIVLLIVLMFAEMPVAFAMFVVGFLGLAIIASPDAALNILGADVWEGLSSYGMSVVPLFVFMGNIVFRSGVTNDLFNAAYKWVGRMPGGMAGTTIAASTGFAAICGSNAATCATMGTIALPVMQKYKYDDALSAGSVAVGGTLGVVIPPSVVLIIIALQTEQSIAQLFVASIIPGLILSGLFIATIYALCRRNPKLGPAGPKVTLKEKVVALNGVIETLVLFLFVIGGMYAGWFTPTEGGAAGSFGALVIALVRRKLNWPGFKAAVLDTLHTSAMVILLVVGATVLGRFLTFSRMPYELADWVTGLALPSLAVLGAIIAVYVLGGMFTDALGFLTLSVPVFFPLASSLGYDLAWFSVLITIITTMGAITPPVGVCLFITKGLRPDLRIETVTKGAMWFLPAYGVCIALLIALPQLVTGIVR